EVARAGGGPTVRLHGEAPQPQGRGRGAARPLPRRDPVRAPSAANAVGSAERAPARRRRVPRGPTRSPEARRPARPRPGATVRAGELHEPTDASQAEGVGGAGEGARILATRRQRAAFRELASIAATGIVSNN